MEDFMEKLLMTKKYNGDFMKSSKCWICEGDYVEGGVKVRTHCHITEKYRDYNINVKLNCKILVTFHNLKNYFLHPIMQELGKLNFKTNFISNGLEKYVNFNINNKLIPIDSF